jgi:hypothetical protein
VRIGFVGAKRFTANVAKEIVRREPYRSELIFHEANLLLTDQNSLADLINDSYQGTPAEAPEKQQSYQYREGLEFTRAARGSN